MDRADGELCKRPVLLPVMLTPVPVGTSCRKARFPARVRRCGKLSPNPPMGCVKAGQIGMREPTGEKPGLHWDRCDTAEGFQ